MSSRSEKTTAFVLMAGVALLLLSMVVGFMFLGGGALQGIRTGDASLFVLVAIPILMFLAGLGMVGGGLWYGIWFNKKQHEGPQEAIPGVRVVARYAFSRDGQMLTQDWQLEQFDRVRFYVRLEVPGKETAEYECAEPTYRSAGEGMRGEASIQGKWLGQFTPSIGGAPTSHPSA